MKFINRKMFKEVFYKIISTWIVLIVLFPMSVQFAHSFEDHAYNECKEKKIQHLHEKHIDCDFNHFLLNTKGSLMPEVVETQYLTYSLTTPTFFIVNCKEIQLLLNSSRAPPILLLS